MRYNCKISNFLLIDNWIVLAMIKGLSTGQSTNPPSHHSSLFPNRSLKFISSSGNSLCSTKSDKKFNFPSSNNDIERAAITISCWRAIKAWRQPYQSRLHRMCISHTNTYFICCKCLCCHWFPISSIPFGRTDGDVNRKHFSAVHKFLFIHSILNCGLFALSIACMRRGRTAIHIQPEPVIHIGQPVSRVTNYKKYDALFFFS